MRSGKCLLGSSSITWRLVTRNRRSSRWKKKPLALVSGRWPSKVLTRAAASSSDSMGRAGAGAAEAPAHVRGDSCGFEGITHSASWLADPLAAALELSRRRELGAAPCEIACYFTAIGSPNATHDLPSNRASCKVWNGA